MRTILVPIDFSAHSLNAARYAVALAKKTQAKIILMHAFESIGIYSKIPLTTMQVDYATLYNSAAKKIQAFQTRLKKETKGMHIELSIQQGLPSARAIEIAQEKKADLIVMGTTGKGAVERLMFGSNAIRLIRNAPCMVLLVPPKAVFGGMKRFAFATDFSPENIDHANKLIPMMKEFNSELIFLNVRDQSMINREELNNISSELRQIVKYDKITGYVSTDNDKIGSLKFSSKNHKVDCLVIYTHHRNVFNRIFGTSLASELSLHTSIPLLVLHESDMPVMLPVKAKSESKSKKTNVS